MSRPTTRVLAVLELLQTHGRMNGSELAKRIEVDARTLRRYIVTLEDMGIPITADRGRHGAYMLVAGFKLPPMMFNEEEALALSIGLVAARGLGLARAAPAVASAQAKLERVMPAALMRRVRAVDETVALDLSPAVPPRDNAALMVLSAAAQARQRVHMRYRAASRQETERDFDPYGVAYRGGCWYAVGVCHLRGGLRSFRLDRVLGAEPLEKHFTRPREFDVLSYLALNIATLPRAFAIEVLLKTELPAAMAELPDTLGVLERVPGGVLLLAQADDLEWFARRLAGLSFDFEVRRPAALRVALDACAKRLARLAKGRT